MSNLTTATEANLGWRPLMFLNSVPIPSYSTSSMMVAIMDLIRLSSSEGLRFRLVFIFLGRLGGDISDSMLGELGTIYASGLAQVSSEMTMVGVWSFTSDSVLD
jgi:hypothetical protein